jgi:GNAT superfamily N-acetyltransferase
MTRIRQERRRECPLLPPGLDDASAARRILANESDGVVALSRSGDVVGFLFAKRHEDPLWGNSIVLDADGWALTPEAGVSPLAELYAAGFGPKTGGVDEHTVHCPAHEVELLQAWSRLGFGMEQAYAAARLDEIDTADADIAGVEIRRARTGDEEALVSLSSLIATMQAAAPVWAGAPPSYLAELREGFAGLPTDQDAIVLLAFRAGRAVGYQAWFPMEAHPVDGVTEGAVELPAAATVPEERGRGVGRALTDRGVSEARDSGYSICFTDWRTANPLASAFWQARGFKPFLYRLVRRLVPRG